MNYIWYPLIEAIQLGYDTNKIRYRLKDMQFSYDVGGDKINYINRGNYAYHVSPLLEYLPLVLYDTDDLVNQDEKFSRIDVNPYHRFDEIFEDILSIERNDENDLIVCDIITHILAHIDRICGMSKRDFRLLLIMSEIDAGCFGDADIFKLFSVFEKRALAEILLMFYETSNSLRCLENLFNMIMTDFNIRIRDNTEILFYSPCIFDECEDKKLRFIIKLFLPVDFSYVIHWQYSYGTINHDESIILEKFVL